MRLFKDQPKWEALPRSEEVERSEAREEYEREFVREGVAAN